MLAAFPFHMRGNTPMHALARLSWPKVLAATALWSAVVVVCSAGRMLSCWSGRTTPDETHVVRLRWVGGPGTALGIAALLLAPTLVAAVARGWRAWSTR